MTDRRKINLQVRAVDRAEPVTFEVDGALLTSDLVREVTEILGLPHIAGYGIELNRACFYFCFL